MSRALLIALAVLIAPPAFGQEPLPSAPAPSAPAPSARGPTLPPVQALPAAEEIARFTAREARQGVAVDRQFFYAVVNSAIGKYDRRTGAKVAEWRDETRRIQHINSCVVLGRELVCANSNFPETPMASSVEVFDTRTLAHLRSESIGPLFGSLTWLVRHQNAWWATFANYEETGGEPNRGAAYTTFAKLDENFRPIRAWMFPKSAIAAFTPTSSSGGVFGDDGLIYTTGHSAKEIYVLRLPKWGPTLEHLATIPAPMEGQAIAWDPAQRRVIWGIVRRTGEVVAARIPEVPQPPR